MSQRHDACAMIPDSIQPLPQKQQQTPRFAIVIGIYTASLPRSPFRLLTPLSMPLTSIAPQPLAPPRSAPLRLALLVINRSPSAKERDLVLDGVDSVADNGEDDEEDDDYYRYHEVAGYHFGWLSGFVWGVGGWRRAGGEACARERGGGFRGGR